MSTMNKPRPFASALCLALLVLIARSVWGGPTVEFTNPNLIKINTPTHPIFPGDVVLPMVATPYPSTINVSGFAANETIEKITVTFHNLSHGSPTDIDMLLVGPEDQTIILFSDAGGGWGDPDVPDPIFTVTLDDDAVESLPRFDPIVSGTYKPTNYELDGDDEELDIFPDHDEFDVPTLHPDPVLYMTLAVFAGTHPNGEWRLYIVDDEITEEGIIAGGWSLTIKTGPPPPRPSFRRSDASADGAVDITDAVVTLGALFLGETLECTDAADADDNGMVELTDVIYTLDYLFLSGPVPPAPGLTVCGVDPTPDALPCVSSPTCP